MRLRDPRGTVQAARHSAPPRWSLGATSGRCMPGRTSWWIAHPKGVDARNRELYEAAGVRYIFQGGAKHELAGDSFVACASFVSALDRQAARVVSCNTTSRVRTLFAIRQAGLLARTRGVLVRRASNPWASHRERILNTMVPEPRIPSHQGPDACTVIPDLDVVTIATKSPQNVGHLHHWFVDLTRPGARTRCWRRSWRCRGSSSSGSATVSRRSM